MRAQPVINDVNNPLVSVIIVNYEDRYLDRLFTEILAQDSIKNLEIIYLDSLASEGAWEIALRYAREYQGIITLHRKSLYDGTNELHYGARLAQGKYIIALNKNDAFDHSYLAKTISAMDADPLLQNDLVIRKFDWVYLRQTKMSCDRPNLKGKPLVNVFVHNYNYGKYLRECLDSLVNQTYDNIEVIFSDNNSTDDSWDIAVEYANKYPELMTIMQNRKNFGPGRNLENCYHHLHGKYFCVLCSDDAYAPTFVERCVDIMEENDNVGLTITHRAIIDHTGKQIEEPPFYDSTCIIPGQEQAAVYMMAAVNPSISQVLYNVERVSGELPVGNVLAYRWFSQRFLDFRLSTEFKVGYIKEPLLLNRIHGENDSSKISTNLVELFSQYVLAHQFAEIAASKNDMTKAIERLPASLAKVGRLCPRYAVQALLNKDEVTARRYFHLGMAILPEIEEDENYALLKEYWNASESRKAEIVAGFEAMDNLASRSVSYNVPPGSLILDDKV